MIIGAGAMLGAIGGWLYWSNFGCTTGCAITSSPVNSTLYGSLMGGLVLSLFEPKGHRPDGTQDPTGTL